MGDSWEKGTAAHVLAVIGIDDVADVDALELHPLPPTFPMGSEVHSLDTLLAAYLLDMEVSVPRAAHASWRVLLVESDAAMRRSLWEMLEIAGHTVLTAPTSEGALDMVARHSVDLVLADVGSAVAGLGLRRAVHARRPGLPVIVMSDDPTLAQTWAAADLGAAGFVEKPVRGLLLLEALREAMGPLVG